MGRTSGVREALERVAPEGWDLKGHAEGVGGDMVDDAVMAEPVEGLGEVGAVPEGFLAASTQANLAGNLARADCHRTSRGGDVAGEVPGQQHRGRADDGAVYDLEVEVVEREAWFIAAQWSESEALDGLRRFAWFASVTGAARIHWPPPGRSRWYESPTSRGLVSSCYRTRRGPGPPPHRLAGSGRIVP